MALQEIAARATLYHGFGLGALLIGVVLALPGGLTGGAKALIEAVQKARRQA